MAPGFQITPPYDEAERHQLDVIGAGYQWTMVKELRHTKDIKDLQQLGKVVYVIIEGSLTFNRKDKRGRAAFTGCNKIVHLDGQTHEPGDKKVVLRRQLAVQKGGSYDLEANKQGGYTFVEGHVCLSPAFATELMKAGQIHWVDERGEEVDNTTSINLLEDSVIESDNIQALRGGKVAKKLRFNVTVPDAKTDENARQLKRWFENEWEDHERKRGDTKMLDTKTLYRAAKKKAGGNTQEAEKASEAEESEFNGGSLSSHTLSFSTL